MKIIELRAENIKRLKAVCIRPEGNVVQITGKNGAGKTSLLDAIWWALAGQAAIQGQPIRAGEDRARIRLDLGEIIVTRTFKRLEDGEITTAITVENAEGVRFGSPQRMLDALLGELTFDPLAFARMSAKEQYDTLRAFVPGVDFEATDAAQKADFDRRTTFNRQAREVRAQADGVEIPPEVIGDLPDEKALVEQVVAASKHNAEVERLERVLARLDSLREEAARIAAEITRLEGSLPPQIPNRFNIDALGTSLEAARRTNAAAQAYFTAIGRRQELTDRADALERQSRQLTEAMKRRQADVRAAIAAAAMPVPGLDFGENIVLKDGVPFDQASDAEKLRTSVAIAIAMNPKLRVVRIRDGSLLDADSLRLVAEMAEERDSQVWIERVADDRSVGFVIEDGSVVAREAVTP